MIHSHTFNIIQTSLQHEAKQLTECVSQFLYSPADSVIVATEPSDICTVISVNSNSENGANIICDKSGIIQKFKFRQMSFFAQYIPSPFPCKKEEKSAYVLYG